MNSMVRGRGGRRIVRPIGPGARRRGEGGAATTIILVSMCLLLVAGTLALGRIGHANDLRTKAQTGADAAALGALEPLRRRAIDLALQGIPSDGIGQWMIGGSPDDPAGGYAHRNGTALTGKVRLSGSLGHTAKVSVRTRDCQLKREDELTPQEKADLRMGRNMCTDTSGKRGIGRHGTATAVAAFDPPACVRKFPGGAAVPGEGNPEEGSGHLECDGVKIRPNGGGRAQVAKLFKLRLVDEEDPVPFTGAPSFSDIAGFTGPLPPLPANASALVKKIIAFAYAQIGKPYIWGGTGPAGFDCSGIIWAAYRSAGVMIPRTTFGQFPFGAQVPAGAEQPGDLVFFSSGPGNAPGRPGHVALVVDPGRKLAVEASCTACGPIRVKSYAGRNVAGHTRPLARFGRT